MRRIILLLCCAHKKCPLKHIETLKYIFSKNFCELIYQRHTTTKKHKKNNEKIKRDILQMKDVLTEKKKQMHLRDNVKESYAWK